jgi:hypothetical protein
MLQAAARKQSGDRATAAAELRSYLQEIEAKPIAESGFIPFALYAFLGETEQAIAAFQKAADGGFSKGWWGLKNGTFDPDYAAVWADSRVQQQFTALEMRITAQRDSFLSDPDLPTELLLQAGLAR